jgi:hypothetical protein
VVERPKVLADLRDTGQAWFKVVVGSVCDLVKVEAKPLLNRESPGYRANLLCGSPHPSGDLVRSLRVILYGVSS